MAETRSSEEDRGLFRREVIEYQRQRAFGEAFDMRPLSPLWALIPASALIGLFGLLARVTYRPTLAAEIAVDAGGQVVASVANRPDLLGSLQQGAELRIEFDRQSISMQVLESATAPCGPAAQCLQLKGRLTDQSASVQIHGVARAKLLLPSRSLLDGWKR